MTEAMIIKTTEEYLEMARFIEEAKAELEALKKQLTDELEAREVQSMAAGQYVIRNTEVSSSRFDTKRFKETLGEDLYKTFTKEVLSHKFSIAA